MREDKSRRGYKGYMRRGFELKGEMKVGEKDREEEEAEKWRNDEDIE